ncbi:MAG: serine/threonine-protein kinase [Gemmataceae bacterium]
MEGKSSLEQTAFGGLIRSQADKPTPPLDAPATSPEINLESVEDNGEVGEFAQLLGPAVVLGDLGRLAHYRVLEQLGCGGMGAVFKALDTRLDRMVALKVMRPLFGRVPEAKARFLREARAMAGLSSDHIVTIFQVSSEAEPAYLAMELLEGLSLQAWLEEGGIPTVPEILRLAREIAQGLAAAHERGLIHRDIKPANLWLQAPIGRVKILDFGLVRAGNDPKLTETGHVVGTPQYMSPEQAAGDRLDPRSDLFSFGCVLYRLCTGRLPFDGPNSIAILSKLANHNPVPVRRRNPEIPEKVSDLIMQLLAKNPDDRPASAKQVVRRVRAIERSLASGSRGRRSRKTMRLYGRQLLAGKDGWALVVAGEILVALAFLTGLYLLTR